MTMPDMNARLRAAANQTIAASELLTASGGTSGRRADRGSREMEHLLRDAHYAVVAREKAGEIRFDSAFMDRLRRDYDGPIDLGRVDLSRGQSVVIVEDGTVRLYAAAFGAVAAVIHWLAEQMTPAAEEPPAAEA